MLEKKTGASHEEQFFSNQNKATRGHRTKREFTHAKEILICHKPPSHLFSLRIL